MLDAPSARRSIGHVSQLEGNQSLAVDLLNQTKTNPIAFMNWTPDAAGNGR
jgi:hypothetical protein